MLNTDDIFYGTSTFQGSDIDLLLFFQSIGSKTQLVRSVCVDIRGWTESTHVSSIMRVATVLNYVSRVLHGLEKVSVLVSAMDTGTAMEQYVLNELKAGWTNARGRNIEVVTEIDGQCER